jgi:hypothetical protein
MDQDDFPRHLFEQQRILKELEVLASRGLIQTAL